MGNKSGLEIDAKLENLSQIADFTMNNMIEMGLGEREAFQVQLVVDEITSNIIIHGYKHQTGPIQIQCFTENSEVFIIIEDEGEPFNPLDADEADITSHLEQRKPGGLGIHFMKTMMDDMHYEFKDGKNRLQLIKLLKNQEKSINKKEILN